MSESGPATVLEVDAGDATDLALRVFEGWAEVAGVPLLGLWTPDALVGVDAPNARGYLIDEVYWSTIWIERGAADLRLQLDLVLRSAGLAESREKGDEPNPEAIMTMVFANGMPMSNGKGSLWDGPR